MASYAEMACKRKKATSLYSEVRELSLKMVWREGIG